jgi:hypothetical protein
MCSSAILAQWLGNQSCPGLNTHKCTVTAVAVAKEGIFVVEVEVEIAIEVEVVTEVEAQGILEEKAKMIENIHHQDETEVVNIQREEIPNIQSEKTVNLLQQEVFLEGAEISLQVQLRAITIRLTVHLQNIQTHQNLQNLQKPQTFDGTTLLDSS